MNKQEFLWIFVASTLIIAFGSLPTWAGYRAETQEIRFRGLYFDAQDYAVHISMMEAGTQGETAYRLRFTTEPHDPAYLRLFYVALGHASRALHLSKELTYDLSRWLFGYSALFSLYALINRIFSELFWSRVAFLLAALGSGLGWLQLSLNWTPGPITPIDFWLIDCYVFFSLSLFPHFAFVTTGMCAILYLWLRYLEKQRWQPLALIVLTSILVQFANPIALVTVDAGLTGAVLAGWWKNRRIRWSDFFTLGVLALAQTPLLAYNFLVLSTDPTWSQFTAQNITLSPSIAYYFWGLAPFLPFAVIGLIDFFREKSSPSAMMIFWVVTGFTLAYAPVFIQRRFLQNITIPLAILATQGLIKLLETKAGQNPFVRRWQKGLAILFLVMASFSSIQLSLGRIRYTQTYPPELYYPASLDMAVTWLQENAQYNDFVLAAEETSQVLTQKAGTRAYFGHEMETLEYETKQALVNEFFNGQGDMAIEPVRWVVYGPYEQAINPAFVPAELELAYEEQGLKIFEVK